jgi:hypothetical protein
VDTSWEKAFLKYFIIIIPRFFFSFFVGGLLFYPLLTLFILHYLFLFVNTFRKKILNFFKKVFLDKFGGLWYNGEYWPLATANGQPKNRPTFADSY